MKQVFLLISLSCYFLSYAQTSYVENSLKKHIYYLAHDSLEGRMTGDRGEDMARDYIISQFQAVGLEGGFGKGFVQDFSFTYTKRYQMDNYLKLNGIPLELHEDYFVLSQSANGELSRDVVGVQYGISLEQDYDDYKGIKNLEGNIALIKLYSPDGDDPHSKFYNFIDITTKIKKAEEQGAAAAIFINVRPNLSDPDEEFRRKVKQMNIPAVFVTESGWQKLEDRELKMASLKVSMKAIIKTGHNVIGKIDNNAAYNVYIGAHYDHLGYGISEGSLHSGKLAIHNGADDNASGVALMIELAAKIKQDGLADNNYYFVAFSGEELGLFGSKSYVNSEHFDKDAANYMLNFDMVGRLDDNTRKLGINGVGTSSAWEKVLKDDNPHQLALKTTESGIGPSDHSSFYFKNVPAIHFFSGTHSDYHKPEDDVEKLNYAGMESIFDFVYDLIVDLDGTDKIDFNTTKANSSNVPGFTVTLGVVPDYMFEEAGMRIDAVSEDKPAKKAGIKAGDIVIKMSELEVTDMMSYMKGLSQHKKGDKTMLTVLRDGKEKRFEVQF